MQTGLSHREAGGAGHFLDLGGREQKQRMFSAWLGGRPGGFIFISHLLPAALPICRWQYWGLPTKGLLPPPPCLPTPLCPGSNITMKQQA